MDKAEPADRAAYRALYQLEILCPSSPGGELRDCDAAGAAVLSPERHGASPRRQGRWLVAVGQPTDNDAPPGLRSSAVPVRRLPLRFGYQRFSSARPAAPVCGSAYGMTCIPKISGNAAFSSFAIDAPIT